MANDELANEPRKWGRHEACHSSKWHFFGLGKTFDRTQMESSWQKEGNENRRKTLMGEIFCRNSAHLVVKLQILVEWDLEGEAMHKANIFLAFGLCLCIIGERKKMHG
jgi:hypothetical protein